MKFSGSGSLGQYYLTLFLFILSTVTLVAQPTTPSLAVHISETSSFGTVNIQTTMSFANSSLLTNSLSQEVRREYYLGRRDQLDTTSIETWTIKDASGSTGGRSRWRVHRGNELSQTRALVSGVGLYIFVACFFFLFL